MEGSTKRVPLVKGVGVAGAVRGAGGVSVAMCGAGGVDMAACGVDEVNEAMRGAGMVDRAGEGWAPGSDSRRESRSVGGEEPTRGNTSSSKMT
jgi:hypothetical protein